MILFPAIDLIAGKVVRLAQGDRSRMTVYSENPAEVAREFAAAGTSWIHAVDLSATFEEDDEARAANLRAIEAICAVPGISVDAGGGVRSLESAQRLFDLGVSRVAMGTALVRDPELAAAAAQRFGASLVADIAAKDGVVRVNGWREGAGLNAAELVEQLSNMGFKHLVFTDVVRDGMRSGIDASAYARIAEAAGFPVVASGGISSLDDLRALAALDPSLIEGAIVGRALYEHEFTLEEALEVCHAV